MGPIRCARQSAGFTLIELLIVVAIIGILAAIAVPNFMNARVRAKVAQAKADIRTLAMAHEQYYLDNNTYPNESEHDPWQRKRVEAGLFWLTTPVAYLSAIPLDPFRNIHDPEVKLRAYETGVYSALGSDRNIAYFIFTVGPDMEENGLYSANPFSGIQRNNGEGNTYAMSNGLVSHGDIYWYGGNARVIRNLGIDGKIYNGAFPPNFGP